MAAGADACEIVPYEPRLKARVVALQRLLWRGDDALNRAYLEWKYERNPYFAEPLIYLALSGGDVVGMRGMVGSCWETAPGAERFVVPCAEDFTIAPAHRNRGLFPRVMRLAVDDLATRGHGCAFSLSAGAVTLAGSLAGGWRGVVPLRPALLEPPGDTLVDQVRERLSRVPGLWRLAQSRPLRRLGLRFRPFAHLDRRGGRGPVGAGGVSVDRAPRSAAMADLVRRLGHDGRLRHVRDEAYLAWRFANPLHEYRFVYRGSGDRLEGYLVLQAYRLDEARGVNIVDWEGETPEIRAGLLRAALDGHRFKRLGIWTAGLSDGAQSPLREAGFAPQPPPRLSRPGPWVLVRSLRADRPAGDLALGGRRLADPASWDMRMVYSMEG